MKTKKGEPVVRVDYGMNGQSFFFEIQADLFFEILEASADLDPEEIFHRLHEAARLN